MQLLALLLTLHNFIAERHPNREPLGAAEGYELGIMGSVKMIGSGVIGLAVITLVVNQVLTINAINNSSGPFTGVIDSINTTGESAMTLLVVGLLVAAAAFIMSVMGRF